MSINVKSLNFADQLKFQFLSPENQKKIIACSTIDEAIALLKGMDKETRLPMGTYEPKLQESGSTVKYKTKKLFTETFEEEDINDFMTLADMSATMEDEIVLGELKRKMNSMIKDGKQPLQCMVYSTKHNEKVFFNNEVKLNVWANAIADFVNENREYSLSINHMLVNWEAWKRQIMLLIKACTNIRKNEKLDEVIRDLYINSEDDKIKYAVMKRLLHGCNKENYQGAFTILKNTDFIGLDAGRKYYNALKRKLENANPEEWKTLYNVFRSTQGLGGSKRKRIESLFSEKEESGFIKRLNESPLEEKNKIMEEIYYIVYGSQSDLRELVFQSREIKKYKSDIQEIFMDKIQSRDADIEDIKLCGLAIGNLDSDTRRAIPFIKQQMAMCMDEEKEIAFSYVLANLSDSCIYDFFNKILRYDANNAYYLINSVRNLNKSGKNPMVRQALYENCVKIKDQFGVKSNEFKVALTNIGDFLQGKNTVAIYDIQFDQILFEYVGYSKQDNIVNGKECSAWKVNLVLNILEKVMDRNNYEARYEKFMWSIFKCIKETGKDLVLANKIDALVKGLTGQGIPSI